MGEKRRKSGAMSSKARASANAASGERINSELFTLTYGALVRHLLLDLESPEEVNKQLDKMGHNIGIRLVDDFLAKTNTRRCRNFSEATKTIAETGFKMFLGVTARVSPVDDKECKIVFNENPLTDFVELPEKLQQLRYCNLLCGVIRGALEHIHEGGGGHRERPTEGRRQIRASHEAC